MGQLATRFGKVGAKGEAGETFLFEKLKQDYTVSDYRTDMVMQSQGIDFGIQKPNWRREYTLDVKNSLYISNDYYAFKIEIEDNGKAGWFYTSKADRIYHTNAWEKKYLYYELNELRYYVTSKLLKNDFSTFNVVDYKGYVLLQFQMMKGQDHPFPISQIYC
jgi:hypothetical protein